MHQLFTTLVYQEKLSFDLHDLKNEIWQTQKADHAGRKWSKKNYRHGYTSYGSWDQMHLLSSTFAKLQKKIDAHVLQYLKKLDYAVQKNTLQMDTFWINIMPENTIHTAHIHPQSVISGTFYVDIPKGSGAIRFEDPRLGFFMNAPTLKTSAKKQNQRFFSVNPKAGDIVLFESWLKHEVPMSRGKEPRISVSFNYGWK
jgi:uncharacterized protein (TIGR02466 family)